MCARDCVSTVCVCLCVWKEVCLHKPKMIKKREKKRLFPAFHQMVTPEPNWCRDGNEPQFFLLEDCNHVHELRAHVRLWRSHCRHLAWWGLILCFDIQYICLLRRVLRGNSSFHRCARWLEHWHHETYYSFLAVAEVLFISAVRSASAMFVDGDKVIHLLR